MTTYLDGNPDATEVDTLTFISPYEATVFRGMNGTLSREAIQGSVSPQPIQRRLNLYLSLH
jgi:hypothetical protein